MTENASVKDKAAESTQAGKEAASELASTASEQVQNVAGEAQKQARDLVGEARGQVRSQVSDQHRSAVTNLRSLGDELTSMSRQGSDGGVATDLVSRAAGHAHGAADWLDGREPDDILDEVRAFARRRPGAFLLGALAAGVVAGRLGRGAVAAHQDDSPSGAASTPSPAHAAPVVGDQAVGDQADYGNRTYGYADSGTPSYGYHSGGAQ